MKFSDGVEAHVASDPSRVSKLEQRAAMEQFRNISDYIDHVQGHAATRSFDAGNDRTCWMNPVHRLVGFNNHAFPEKSTAIPKDSAKHTLKTFQRYREEAGIDIGVRPKKIEIGGPLPKKLREVSVGTARSFIGTKNSERLRQKAEQAHDVGSKNRNQRQDAITKTRRESLLDKSRQVKEKRTAPNQDSRKTKI